LACHRYAEADVWLAVGMQRQMFGLLVGMQRQMFGLFIGNSEAEVWFARRYKLSRLA
jgi:hypothetical protein